MDGLFGYFCPKSNINQAKIIRKLDAYVQEHPSSLNINATGICNALSHLYAKYCLEGRKDEFFDLLKYISENPVEAFSTEVSQFVVEIFVSHAPQSFNQELNQNTAHQALFIEGEPLHCALSVAMIRDGVNWKAIFKDIELQDNEAIVVIGKRHTVCVSKEEDGYLLYDPNNLTKPQHIKIEAELISALRECASFDAHGPLALTLSVLQHPQKKRSLPFNARVLYGQFLTQDNINMKTKILHNVDFSILDMMLQSSEITLADIEWAISLGAESAIDQYLFFGMMIGGNVSDDIILYFIKSELKKLQREPDVYHEDEPENEEVRALQKPLAEGDAEKKELLETKDILDRELKLRFSLQRCVSKVIEYGPEALFDKFKTEGYLDVIYGEEWPYEQLLDYAARSGNASMLSKIFGLYIDSYSSSTLEDIMDKNDLIVAAIKGGSAECLAYVLQKLLDKKYADFTEKKLLNYLSKAVVSNNHRIVDKIIKIIPEEQLKSVHIPLKVMEQITLPVLLLLKERGVPFSDNAEYILSQKAKQPSSTLSWLLVILEKIKDYLLSRQDIQYKTADTPKDGTFSQQSIFTATKHSDDDISISDSEPGHPSGNKTG